MLDQTFSAENFQILSDVEKRRGHVLDLAFFPEVKQKTDVLRDQIKATKAFRKSHTGTYNAADQQAFELLKQKREMAREERDEQLLACLKKVAYDISRNGYFVDYVMQHGPNGKPVFMIKDADPTQYYALKQLSKNISRLYKVKQSNRNQIVSQLKDFLSDGFDYHVIRTDISSFFESLDQNSLLEKIKTDQLLSRSSIKMITQILYRYGILSGTSGVGVPRGLGISSYLSELYMRDIDDEIRNMQDVVFYARYVDDIIIIFAPMPTSRPRDYLAAVREKLAQKKLTMNDNKTDESPLTVDGNVDDKSGWSLEYLGYKFTYSPKFKVQLSDKKHQRYVERLTASFVRYNSQRAKNAKSAFRLLVKRIRFLTGNTQLVHNKKNAYVGVYFSNPHLSDLNQLKDLDNRLRGLTASLTSTSLKLRLTNLSFQQGYEQKIFRRFHRKDEFREIVKAWKYGN